MAIYQVENWARLETMPEVENDSVFIMCNLSQFVPDTPVFAGKTGLHFISCNLVNCDLPPDTLTDDCNTATNIYAWETVGGE